MELKIILKALLKEEGISISQLSRRTTVPVQTLHNWLNGIEPRSLKQVRKVSEHFEVSLDYLCFGVRKENQTTGIEDYTEEINAGIFEVVLRRVKKQGERMSSLIDSKKTLTPDEREILRSELDRKKKSTGIAYFLWFILSFVGLHKFYLGRPLKGFLFLLAPFLSLYLFFGRILTATQTNSSQESEPTADGLIILGWGIWGTSKTVNRSFSPVKC